MLVINRRKNQELVLGDDIRVVILAVKKNKVKFGIHAPAEIEIGRRTGYDIDPVKANISENSAPKHHPAAKMQYAETPETHGKFVLPFKRMPERRNFGSYVNSQRQDEY